MREPLWLTKELVLTVHERLIAEFGGHAGLRDEGLLESALAKPLHLFAYSKPDIFELAASYAFGIVRNHPFLDGNKRTGFVSAAVFLETNGHRLSAKEVEATEATVAVAEGRFSQKAYAVWLGEHSRREKRRVQQSEGKKRKASQTWSQGAN